MTPPAAATAAGRTKRRAPAKRAGAKRAGAAKAGGGAKGTATRASGSAKRTGSAKRAAAPKGRASASRAKARPNAGHGARTLRRSSVPRAARRVSGPTGGRAAAVAIALPRPQLAPLGPRLVAFASTLPDRSIVERMVRGRWWIGVLGILLIGLVFTQVSLLKLNAGIGRDVQRSAALERANGSLRAQVSQLESGERIQQKAAALGMVMPPAGQISYLRGGDVGAAVSALDQGRFNDPAKAIALPGTEEPPDPLAAALTEEADGTGDGASGATGQGEAADGGSGASESASSESDSDGTHGGDEGRAVADETAEASPEPGASESAGGAAAPGGE